MIVNEISLVIENIISFFFHSFWFILFLKRSLGISLLCHQDNARFLEGNRRRAGPVGLKVQQELHESPASPSSKQACNSNVPFNFEKELKEVSYSPCNLWTRETWTMTKVTKGHHRTIPKVKDVSKKTEWNLWRKPMKIWRQLKCQTLYSWGPRLQERP